MSSGVKEFLVQDVDEEYFILSRILCPRCRGRLKMKMQSLHHNMLKPEEREKLGASHMTDGLLCKCIECGYEIKLFFHEKRLKEFTEVIKKAIRDKGRK